MLHESTPYLRCMAQRMGRLMYCGYPAPAVPLMVGRGAEIGFFRDEIEWWGKRGTDNGSQRDRNGQRVYGRGNYEPETKSPSFPTQGIWIWFRNKKNRNKSQCLALNAFRTDRNLSKTEWHKEWCPSLSDSAIKEVYTLWSKERQASIYIYTSYPLALRPFTCGRLTTWIHELHTDVA
jgi:hypothetical protein